MNIVEVLRLCHIAMGGSTAVMDEWRFQSRIGWHPYCTPDTIIALAARNKHVKSMVWC